MYERHQIFRKTLFNNSQNSVNSSYSTRCNKITPGKLEGKVERNNHGDIKPLPFKIPMAYVVPGATELCSQTKCIKHVEQVEKTCKIDENCKQLGGRIKDQTSFNLAFACISGKKIRKSSQETRDNYRTPWFQEQCVKRQRKCMNGDQQIRARKVSTGKRRPLTTSNQQISFMNKDISSAIVSSQVIAKKVQSKSKGNLNLKKEEKKIKAVPKNYVDNVPRFTSIPSEFRELCQNKSVEQLITSKLSAKDPSECHKRKAPMDHKNQITPITQHHTKTVYKERYSSDVAKKTEPTSPHNNTNKQQGFSKPESPSYGQFVRIYGPVENVQIPKNIYIRDETGGEIIEDLVEVRNQEELDVLNIITTLQSVHNKHGTRPVKLFEDLRDYEVYSYQACKPSQ